tara:strand:+ start:13765 stop:14145 length:381 start_codon:yes stop_codon:yes gene_type:complete
MNVEIKETKTQYIIEVVLPKRQYAKDKKISYSFIDAENALKEQGHRLLVPTVDTFGLVISNYGTGELSGTFVFDKPKATRKTRNRRAKIKEPAIEEVDEEIEIEEEPRPSIRDRVKKITNKISEKE